VSVAFSLFLLNLRLSFWNCLFQHSLVGRVWCSEQAMENREVLEFKRTLRRHEEYIQSNMTSLFSITTKVHENEHLCVSQHASIMNLLVQQK
jgi:hypothetical protein